MTTITVVKLKDKTFTLVIHDFNALYQEWADEQEAIFRLEALRLAHFTL